MPDPNLFDGLGHRLLECFGITVVTNAGAQIREDKPLPPTRIFIGRLIYSGMTSVGVGLVGIHYYGIEHSTFLYITSIATGFQTTDFLASLWNKIFAGAIMAAYKRATGYDLVDIKIDQSIHEPENPSIEPARVEEVQDVSLPKKDS